RRCGVGKAGRNQAAVKAARQVEGDSLPLKRNCQIRNVRVEIKSGGVGFGCRWALHYKADGRAICSVGDVIAGTNSYSAIKSALPVVKAEAKKCGEGLSVNCIAAGDELARKRKKIGPDNIHGAKQ